jgi:hypothetical protein
MKPAPELFRVVRPSPNTSLRKRTAHARFVETADHERVAVASEAALNEPVMQLALTF